MDSFFGIGLFELVMIAVVALLVLGPERLPGAMREVAKWMRQLRNISSEFQSQFSEEFKMLDEINPRRIINDALDPNAQPKAPPGQTAKLPAGQSAGQPTNQPAGQSAAKPLAAKPVTPPAAKPAAAAAAKPVNAAFPTGPTVAAATAAQADVAQTGAGSEPENTILPPAPSAAEPEPPADAAGQPAAAPAAAAAAGQESEAAQ